MVIGVLQIELLLHAPHSLKEKRGIIRKILGRCRERFPVSCAETGMHDLWQRGQLGFAMVDQEEGSIHAVFQRVEEQIVSTGVAEVIARQVEFLHYGNG
jgi:uncharacterized protein YlxP (DUF503 family)